MLQLLRIRSVRLVPWLFPLLLSQLLFFPSLLLVLAVLSMIDALMVPEAVEAGVNPLADVTDRFLAGPGVNVLYVPLQPR